MSVVADDSEWQTRRISILGAVKSFIGQLTVGQDLVKVSLPSQFVYPYSGLELGAMRALEYFSLLQRANETTDPVMRLSLVVAYYISKTRAEKFEKKPSNPILGENHYCWTETPNGKVFYLAEQVCHHPPVSAYSVQSKGDQINTLVNFESKGIKFHGNSVGISVDRKERIELNKLGEIYNISKAWPDMMVRNVILGTKRESWEGEVVITCPQTDLKAVLTYKEEGWWCVNVVNVYLYHKTEFGLSKILRLAGTVSAGLKTAIWSLDDISTPETSPLRRLHVVEETIVDYTAIKPYKLQYMPPDEWDERSSLRIWKDMFKAIIADDMPKADAAKKIVEDAQRNRRKDGNNFNPIFFSLNESNGMWEPRLTDLENPFAQKEELTAQSPSFPSIISQSSSESDPHAEHKAAEVVGVVL